MVTETFHESYYSSKHVPARQLSLPRANCFEKDSQSSKFIVTKCYRKKKKKNATGVNSSRHNSDHQEMPNKYLITD